MKNSFFKEICSKVNYNIYDDVQKTSFLVSFFATLFNDFYLKQDFLANNSVDFLAGVILFSDVLLSLSNGKAYTNDVVQIRELYGEFIKNYNKLNKLFDLNDPIQIHVMFNFLLKNGFLSCDKKYDFSGDGVKDLNEISGANIICGRGVCRHVAAMFSDILNDYGIFSGVLGVYLRNCSFKVNYLDLKKYTKEELCDWVHTYINDKGYSEVLMNMIDVLVDIKGENIEFDIKYEDEKNFLLRVLGNHAITYAFKDEKSYFLDPTQNRIYRMYDSNKLCDVNGEALIKFMLLNVHNSLKCSLDVRKKVLEHYPSILKQDEVKMILDTLKICRSNIDIFESFYKDNCELYSDVSNKMLKIRSSIIIR
jgi:hypothetical protein